MAGARSITPRLAQKRAMTTTPNSGGELGRDIWSEARIAHHLGLMYQDVYHVRFEAAEFNEEGAQETGR